MRKEKERSWFQYGSIGFMGSGEDSRFKYSFVESSLKLLLLAPMICKISVEYRTTWVYRANSSYNISPCWTCSQLLKIIRSISIFSSIESLNGLNLICNDLFQIMQFVHLNKKKLWSRLHSRLYKRPTRLINHQMYVLSCKLSV